MDNRMRRMRSVVMAMLITVLVSGFTQAQEQKVSGFLQGQVFEQASGKPVANAKIKYRTASMDQYVIGTYTDSKGLFHTQEFYVGTIIVVWVSAEGYRDKIEEAITQEGSTEIQIRLEPAEEEKEWVRRDFQIMHRDVADIYHIVRPYLVEKHSTVSERLRTISAYGHKEGIEKVEALIEKYDTPLKQVWLEVVLILATGNGVKKAEYPEEIADVVKQLQSLFKFGKYTVVGRADAMGLEGTELFLQSKASGLEQAEFVVRTQLGYSDDVIRLQNLEVAISEPHARRMHTTANVRNGETVVLGISRGDAQEGSLITVVTAKVMESP